ncbi:MAG: WYL domain-containing protein [Bacteroidia bacterium]|nr:WYL domain-containing protein [Bacteroidia bacterium]
MANTKGFGERQQVIDECLQSSRGYSFEEMRQRCNVVLEKRGFSPVSALNTIRADVEEIENKYGEEATVEMIRIGRVKRYRYKNEGFSIYKAPLPADDLEHLKEMMDALSLYEGRPQFEWISDLMGRLQSTTSIVTKDKNPVVGFDENLDLVGREHFQPILDFIKYQKAIQLTYRSFNSDNDIVVTFHPYYLRQYNNRWFLFGECDNRDDLTNYALDRIVNIKESSVPYRPNNGKYDFTEYFDDFIGVSKKGDTIEEVILLITQPQYNYIKTKPLHSTQTVIENRGEGGVVIRIKVIPNRELEQKILSYGDGITVLSPAHLRETICERINASLEKYKKVQF